MADWHDRDSLRARWTDAGRLSDDIVDELLEVAAAQIKERGTREITIDEETEAEIIPVQYRMAQWRYARALWESGTTNSTPLADAGVEGGEYQVKVYPMDSTLLDLIAPKVPRVG